MGRKSLGFHKDGRKIYTKIPCPLCSGEQGHVQNVVENYEGHDWDGNAIDQFRVVPVRKCLNCGAFHDKHGNVIEGDNIERDRKGKYIDYDR